jgi:hypothetical protein
VPWRLIPRTAIEADRAQRNMVRRLDPEKIV